MSKIMYMDEEYAGTGSVYVVESGTDGDWTYRKWSDGTAECWRNYSANFWINNAYGSMYMSTTVTITFPTGLFIAEPMLTTGGAVNSGASWVSIHSLTSTNFAFRLMNGTSITNLASNPSFYAVGKWQ